MHNGLSYLEVRLGCASVRVQLCHDTSALEHKVLHQTAVCIIFSLISKQLHSALFVVLRQTVGNCRCNKDKGL